MIFSYKGKDYPEYLKHGNACQFIVPTAKKYCVGRGLDVGCSEWPLPGAIPIDIKNGQDAKELPDSLYDYIFSSHCLEHLSAPFLTLAHWKTRLQRNGVLFLYLPHPDMEYWRPENCQKHKHIWQPQQVVDMLKELGFRDVLYGERDLAWSFAVVAWNR